MTNVVAISTSYWHNLAEKNDGTVWVWEKNNYGQLGDSTTTSKYTPQQISGMTGVAAIAADDNHCINERMCTEHTGD